VHPLIRGEEDQHTYWDSLPTGVKQNLKCAEGSVSVDPEQLALSTWYRHKAPVSKKTISLVLSTVVLLCRIGSPLLVASTDEGLEHMTYKDTFEVTCMILLVACGYLLQHTMLIFVVVSNNNSIQKCRRSIIVDFSLR
jgi:hypothetical protein